MLCRLVFIAFSLLLSATASCAIPSSQALELGRKYTRMAYHGSAADSAALWAQCSPEMRKALESEPKFAAILDQLKSQLGSETKLLNERVMPKLQYRDYTRLVEYEHIPGQAVVSFTFDDSGKIAGFYIRPVPNPAPTKYLDYKDKNRYTFPLRGGDVIVWQGGSSVYDNYHAVFQDERFAFDLMEIKNGEIFDGRQSTNEDFYCFGAPVAAAAAGTVVEAVDRYADNPPLKPGEDPKQGNNIVIDHGNGEFGMYAHLKRGSVRVKMGDKVKAGDEIGACGNSGNSPLPHLHFHLQTTAAWLKGNGLPVQFSDITINGRQQASASPVRGDIITSPLAAQP